MLKASLPRFPILLRARIASAPSSVNSLSGSRFASFTKKKEKKGASEDGESMKYDEELWKLRPQWVELKRTQEQLKQEEQLVKSYCKLKMTKLRQNDKEESARLRMKLEALNELPPDLRAAALVEQITPAPLERVMPLWTAPIPDYQQTLPPEKRDEPFDFTKVRVRQQKKRWTAF